MSGHFGRSILFTLNNYTNEKIYLPNTLYVLCGFGYCNPGTTPSDMTS